MDQNDKNKNNRNDKDRRRGVLSLLIWALVLTIGFNYLLTQLDTAMRTDGSLYYGYYHYSRGSRPAFLIPSYYAVQAESDDTGNLLEQLGVDEIVAKLADEITAALKKHLNS